MILKFKQGKKVELVPCRTSETISNYDAFAEHFLSFVGKHFEADKEKTENRPVKRVAVALLVLAHVSFFVLLFFYGLAAAKIIPAMLVVYGVCLPLIFSRKRTGQRSAASQHRS